MILFLLDRLQTGIPQYNLASELLDITIDNFIIDAGDSFVLAFSSQ